MELAGLDPSQRLHSILRLASDLGTRERELRVTCGAKVNSSGQAETARGRKLCTVGSCLLNPIAMRLDLKRCGLPHWAV